MKQAKIKLTWYGRCCFLIEINGVKILTDPHDTFDGVDMGQVKADYLLSSSSWHDHGHIGASPHSIVRTEPGEYKIGNGITIVGIETKEERGSKNVIFNINANGFSITNFADWGRPTDFKNLTANEKKIIKSTNIAFGRAHQILVKNKSNNFIFKVCNPQILIPHHYYPPVFSKRTTGKLSKNLLTVWKRIMYVVDSTEYTQKNIKGASTTINLKDYKEKTALLFNDMHKQVKQVK